MKTLLLIAILALSGCATTPATKPGDDPAVYKPTQRVTYPAPF